MNLTQMTGQQLIVTYSEIAYISKDGVNDFLWLPGQTLAAYPGVEGTKAAYKAYVWDGSNVAVAYLGAAGAGETLGGELVDDGDMSVPASWNVVPPASIVGGVAVFGAGGSIQQDFPGKVAVGALTKTIYTVGTVNETGIKLNTGASRMFNFSAGFRTTNATFTEYLNIFYTPGALTFYGYTSTGTLDNVSLKQVTDCPATALHCFSDITCSTRGWVSDTGIDPNAASYTIQIFKV